MGPLGGLDLACYGIPASLMSGPANPPYSHPVSVPPRLFYECRPEAIRSARRHAGWGPRRGTLVREGGGMEAKDGAGRRLSGRDSEGEGMRSPDTGLADSAPTSLTWH